MAMQLLPMGGYLALVEAQPNQPCHQHQLSSSLPCKQFGSPLCASSESLGSPSGSMQSCSTSSGQKRKACDASYSDDFSFFPSITGGKRPCSSSHLHDTISPCKADFSPDGDWGCERSSASEASVLLCEEAFDEEADAAVCSEMLDSPQASGSQQDYDDGCCGYFSEEEDHDALHPQCKELYPPIDANSPISRWAAMYDFSPFVTSVGTTYFARLAARDAVLLRAALANPCWAEFVAHLSPDTTPLACKPIGAAFHRALSDEHWLAAVHITCIYLAAKNCETLQYKRLLQTMLQHIHGCPISVDEAAALELDCLRALDWRLGPFYL